MTVKKAILAFSQSEKVKAGLIWISQTIDQYSKLSAADKPGAIKIIRCALSMIYHDVHLAGSMSADKSWRDVEKHMDMAMVMIDSQVVAEAVFHLTRALSRVTNIGQQSLKILKQKGLF